ncbi:MAG TPA: KamA family radical SAM protein [Thermodesulfobacteriaceae bacterium]|nr:KamA family radical SAM protein [Thermodesulfobacteriaceae bacterium]
MQAFQNSGNWKDWKWQIRNRITSLDALSRLPNPGPGTREGLANVLRRYRYAVTPYYLSLIDWTDPADPIMKQCLPDTREVTFRLPGSEDDPLKENEHMPVPGLIHRYRDRALAMVTTTCAVYCRHCNRKRQWGLRHAWAHSRSVARMVDYIQKTSCIREVIISGGDPLTMHPDKLEGILAAFQAVPHVEVIRLGTRIPVVLPMRVTDDLCGMLARHRPLWINTHFNHPREITAEAAAACDRLLRAGIPVSNQCVLLKGINDSAETICYLCRRLQSIMVRPYYLFHCDSVRGTDHFRTDLRKGIEITRSLWGTTGGLSIPNFVVDLPEGGGKAPLMPSYLLDIDGEEAIFRTFEGKIVRYPCPEGA